MDAESQMLEVKQTKNNTINKINSSNNYIYKKALIKEKYENMINELRSLNFENIANNKMNHMNFNFLINTIINLKKITNTKNPFMKYIRYVKPYNTNIKYSKINIKGNKNKRKFIFKEVKNNLKVNKNVLKTNEKIINFQKNAKNSRNFYYTRMCNCEAKRINSNITEKIILLQKNIRGFLSKKVVDEYINNEIVKTIINNILTIQRAVRKFLLKKKSLDKLIINIIQNERYTKGNKITDIFSLYHYRNLYKKILIIKKIVISRYKNASLIQSTFKSFVLQRKVQKILEKEKKSYTLTYPFRAETVKIKIYMGDELYTYKIFNYFICPIRKFFVTYIDKKLLEPGEYLCHLIVDDSIKIDKRYKFIDRNNILYNLIPFGSHLKKKKKSRQIEIEMEKKKRLIKKQKDREKKINDELDNFYIYYYNSSTDIHKNKPNSVNSLSDNSEQQEINKLDYRSQIDENDPDQVIDISNQFYKSKMNNFLLKSNYKYIKKNNDDDENDKNAKKVRKNNKNKIPLPNKKNNVKNNKNSKDNNLKDLIDKKLFIFQNKFDDYKNDNDDDILSQSQNLNYNNILDELSQSAKSVASNISVRNMHSYSKRTHETKFTNDNKNNNKKLTKLRSFEHKKKSTQKQSNILNNKNKKENK